MYLNLTHVYIHQGRRKSRMETFSGQPIDFLKTAFFKVSLYVPFDTCFHTRKRQNKIFNEVPLANNRSMGTPNLTCKICNMS